MRLLPDQPELGWRPYAWTVYITFFIAVPFLKNHTSRLEWIATALGVVVFFILYFRGFWDGKEWTSIVGLTLLAAGFYPFNPGAGSIFIYAAAFAGWLPVSRHAAWSIGIIDSIAIIESLVFRIHPINAVWPIALVLVVGATNMADCAAQKSNARLRLAHDEIEHLAKVAERERIARDLHDLLGHTLSLIVLKSELAAKMAGRDIERARTEILDVERISRDALSQVRSVVGGYRSRGLSAEIDDARRALSAAGVSLEAELAPASLTPLQEAVLALAIRESVTNVVRHANASRCRIALVLDSIAMTLTIADDGRGTAAPAGYGLTGMRERVESIGGTLSVERDGGTRVSITIPAASPTIQERSA